MRIDRQAVFNTLIFCLIACLCVYVITKDSPRIAYVESAKVLDSYKEMQTARAEYRRHTESWQANLDTLKSTVQQEITSYNRIRPQLSATQRSEKEARIIQRQKQYLDYKKSITQQAAAEEARTTAEVVRKADLLMKQYGQDQGYDLVFAATEAGTIVYGKEAKNITNDLINFLNK